jgi:hypothetical protein
MMGSAFRVVVVLLAAVATFYFVYWVPCSIIRLHSMPLVAWLGSVVCAVLVGRSTWLLTASAPEGFVSCSMTGALVTGAIAFTAGFFGPMVLDPGGNQGPMLGLFITGPLGFLLGGMGGGIYWFARQR